MSPPEATRRPSSLSNLLLWGCMGCVCLPLKSAGNADADGVPIIHKTPSVQPSLLRLQQQNIKERCWIFSGNGRSLWSLLVCFLVTYCSHCKSNWFWSQCYFKSKLLEDKNFHKCSVQKHIWGHFAPLNKTKKWDENKTNSALACQCVNNSDTHTPAWEHVSSIAWGWRLADNRVSPIEALLYEWVRDRQRKPSSVAVAAPRCVLPSSSQLSRLCSLPSAIN